MIDLKHVKYEIVTPALKRIGLASPAAINLVTGIGLVESGYRTRKQIGGPALGYWQMEPATERDCWVNFLDYRPLLAGLIRGVIHPNQPQSTLLLEDDTYAAILCRIRLYRSSDPLPDANCAVALSWYHKRHYNTMQGKADPERNISLFQQAIEA